MYRHALSREATKVLKVCTSYSFKIIIELTPVKYYHSIMHAAFAPESEDKRGGDFEGKEEPVRTNPVERKCMPAWDWQEIQEQGIQP
jgi:hypothetical protein